MPELKAAIVPVTPFQQNCAILWEEPSKRAVVIDPGGEVPRILEAIAKLGVQVERILLTHGHIDHAGGAAALKEALEQAAAASARVDPPAEASPAAGPTGPATIPIEGPDQRDRFLLQGLETQAPTFGMIGVRNVLPDRWLVEGDEVRVGGQSFEVLHCPGHTPGHVVFVNQAARFAIVGDVLFSGSVGRTDFPYGDHAALIHAIRSKLLPLGDDFSFICGHGPGSTIGVERRSNPFVRG
jgi:glyoxylase-like metal-dependent hydrolase (beta-lactamase superfamily II)